jgi:hypothetical protein
MVSLTFGRIGARREWVNALAFFNARFSRNRDVSDRAVNSIEGSARCRNWTKPRLHLNREIMLISTA